MKTHDFLLELGTEELPPKLLINLSNSLRDNLVDELEKLGIAIGKVNAFATPRRLAVCIFKMQSLSRIPTCYIKFNRIKNLSTIDT